MVKLLSEVNIGSIQKLEFVFHTDISTYNPVVLNAGIVWEELEFLPENASLSLTVAETDNGPLFTYRIIAAHAQLRDEVETLLNKYIGNRAVIRVTDHNDRVYILGAPGLPCLLDYSGNTGSSPSEQNAYVINIQVAQPYKAKSA